VQIDAVAPRQPDQASEVPGPYVNVALDGDGQPTKALLGFAARAGVDWQALERITDNRGERFVHRSVKPGAPTAELLPAILAEAVAALPVPRPMRWADHECTGW
jgi:glycyl-tRNA synthetase beta chain